MKKEILSEVNRYREIMGLSLISEQWERKFLDLLGIDLKTMLGKLPGDYTSLEKSLFDDIESVASKRGLNAGEVFQKLESGELKSLGKSTINDIQDVLLRNPDFREKALESFIENNANLKLVYDSISNLGTKLKGAVDKMDKETASKLEDKISDMIYSEKYGFSLEIRNILNKELEETFAPILGDIETKILKFDEDVYRNLDEIDANLSTIGEGGLLKANPKQKAEFKVATEQIKKFLKNSKKLTPATLTKLENLSKVVDQMDPSVFQKLFNKVGVNIGPLWKKGKGGKIAVVALCLLLVGMFPSLGGLVTGALDKVLEGGAVILCPIDFFSGQDWCKKRNQSGSGSTPSNTSVSQPNPTITPLTGDEFKTWFASEYGKDYPEYVTAVNASSPSISGNDVTITVSGNSATFTKTGNGVFVKK